MGLKDDLKNIDLFIAISAFTVGMVSSPWSLSLIYYIIYIMIMEIIYYVLFATTPIQRVAIVLISFIGWVLGKAVFGWYDIQHQKLNNKL